MLLPADIIPDIIPGLGFIDDVSVFLYVWKTVIPYLKEVATEMAEEISTEKIKLLLNDTYKGILIRSGIVLFFNILATLVVCFHPFGEEVSNFTASIVFLLCFGYSIYRGLRWIIKNGKVTAKISLSVIKEKSHLPIIVDPSHATGVRNYVKPLAMSAIAAGADGLMIETHPNPAAALSDGPQSLTFPQFDQLCDELRPIVKVMNRTF